MARPVLRRAQEQNQEPILLEIEDVAFGGQGIARLPDGKVCFIPGVLPGEKAWVRIVDDRAKFAFGGVDRIEEASSHRQEPHCQYFYYCGGCQYGHSTYEHELELKGKQLKDLLKRMAGVEMDITVHAAPESEHYRKSLTLHPSLSGKLGFKGTNPKELIDIESCAIADDKLNQFIKDNRQELLQSMSEDIPIKTDGEVVSSMRRSQVLSYPYKDWKISYNVYCFFQSHYSVLTQMLDVLRKDLNPTDTLFDLYCGVGVFAVCLQDMFPKIVGLEHSRSAVQFAQYNITDTDHIKITKGKVEEKFPQIYKRNRSENNTVILDPPRTGLEGGIIKNLALAPDLKQLVYISCEPSILSRDLKKILATNRFKIRSIQLFDMFPRTKHFETVVIFDAIEKESA